MSNATAEKHITALRPDFCSFTGGLRMVSPNSLPIALKFCNPYCHLLLFNPHAPFNLFSSNETVHQFSSMRPCIHKDDSQPGIIQVRYY